MKRHLFAIICFLGFTTYLHAQDKLYLKSGKIEDVKILEITDNSIRYKLYDNQTGPEYLTDKRKVEKIVYENGQEERFSENVKTKPEKKTREAIDYGNHFVGVNLADLFRTDICLHYEYLFEGGKIGLRVPLLIGFNSNFFNTKSHIENPYVFRRNRVIETGIDMRYYPGGQGKVRYVMGPALHYILNNKRGPLQNGSPVNNHHVNTIRWMLYNGIVFSPAKHFRFGFDVGLGSQYDLSDTKYVDERVFGDPKIQFNWYMGATF